MISLNKLKSAGSTRNKQSGFTIVELLIVIVVIGILAAIVVTTYAGIQGKARNTKRQTDIQAIQTQVEAYFASNNYYPSNADLNLASWRATNMKSLDAAALKDPKGTTSTVATSAPASTVFQYWYIPLNSAGTSCEADDTTCATYTLGANIETGSTYTKTNLD